MNEEIYAKYLQAGQIAAKARDQGLKKIKVGETYLDIVTQIEEQIYDEGAGLAFPVNISKNEIAAHFSPTTKDTNIFQSGDVIKLDVGAHIDGYIADTAATKEIDTNKFEPMIEAVSKALENAIKNIHAKVPLSKIGKIIEQTLNDAGYKPIENLTGHSLQQYRLHAGLSIPNIADRFYRSKPQIDDVIAIEPFATNGAGHVNSGAGSNIYICLNSPTQKLIRNQQIRTFYQQCLSRYKTLPFAQRWSDKISINSERILKKMVFLGLIKQYPQLIEAKQGIVTQKEHTVIIYEDSCEVIT